MDVHLIYFLECIMVGLFIGTVVYSLYKQISRISFLGLKLNLQLLMQIWTEFDHDHWWYNYID